MTSTPTASPIPPSAPSRSRWTLPEDGIVDEIAVEIAAHGIRPVALTPTERRLAAAHILAHGGGVSRICQRLHMGGSTAHALMVSIRTEAATSHAAVGDAAA